MTLPRGRLQCDSRNRNSKFSQHLFTSNPASATKKKKTRVREKHSCHIFTTMPKILRVLLQTRCTKSQNFIFRALNSKPFFSLFFLETMGGQLQSAQENLIPVKNLSSVITYMGCFKCTCCIPHPPPSLLHPLFTLFMRLDSI